MDTIMVKQYLGKSFSHAMSWSLNQLEVYETLRIV